ncbi:MAG: DUF1729 domain-containing protein [Actinomycetaceae bacterium]|nr:DUF1729 domain-containing protein [Actinomycetaceae bacterium]
MTSKFSQPNVWIAHFTGQSTPWRAELAELRSDPVIAARLREVRDAGERLLTPVAPELLTLTGSFDILTDDVPDTPAGSMPGIFLAQYGAYTDVVETFGTEPGSAFGHSQGVLAAELLRTSPEKLFALARMLGAATTRQTLRAGAMPTGNATPMLALRGVDPASLELPEGVTLGIVNTPTSVVVSGAPADLAPLAEGNDTAEFLQVGAPFHSPLLEPAVEQVLRWAEVCGLEIDGVEALVRSCLTDFLDWTATTRQAVPAGSVVVNLGPGTSLGRIAAENLAGAGVTYLEAGTAAARDDFGSGEPREIVTADWSAFAPRARRIDGRDVVETAFTRLTGRSAILVGGMTPTTTDAGIVAAAANAGHWVELAGGGQVSEEILNDNVSRLTEQLQPGRTAQFNAMYMDRYLWELQFGARRIVPRKRGAGAPIDGVVISAGIPELEEAIELVDRLRSEGFPYIAFKPGTVDQIRQVVAIARELTERDYRIPLIAMIEDGQAGGHHSWESLNDLLLATYGQLRDAGVIVCVGGGLGDPALAATYLDGSWARDFGRPDMPVDGVFIGTPLMACREATTSEDVKRLLVETPGIEKDSWVRRGEVRGGMTSGLSTLHADLYQVANSSAACSQLLNDIGKDEQAIAERRDEIIEALNRTAKPYFGDVEDMTYRQMLERFAELTHPWIDESFRQRFIELVERTEARLCGADHGQWPSIFTQEIDDPADAIAALVEAYPAAATEKVTPSDAVYFVELMGKYPKPVPFVAVIDTEIARRWGSDTLWQAHDPRYPADAVRIIPGPRSVAAITELNEPVADVLARFEDAAVARLGEPTPAFSRVGDTLEDYLAGAHFVVWRGHLVENPARIDGARIVDEGEGWEIVVPFDSIWDGTGADTHAVREIRIPLVVPEGAATGALPLVDDSRLLATMRRLLEGTAGVGTTTIGGSDIPHLPDEGEPFTFSFDPEAASAHALVCAPGDSATYGSVPSAFFGSCWPVLYGVIGAAKLHGYNVVEGLFAAVHLDHSERLYIPIEQMSGEFTAVSHSTGVADTIAGRVIGIQTTVTDADGNEVAFYEDRFAMRGRVGDAPLDEPLVRGGVGEVVETPRSTLGKTTVTAPTNMTAFAIVSGDYNPIHTSKAGARLGGLDEPIVHGMWLCAAAEYFVQSLAGTRILGWTYRMFATVDPGQSVDVRVERVGRIRGGGLALEVTCTVGETVVATASTTVAAPSTAYLYPGQGIQTQGMALDERAVSPAARRTWERADAHTREKLGFSILSVVRDNPRELVAGGVRYFHPEGLLNLTQFTQVALATVAAAQTERLLEEGVLVEGSYFAGHSLGEYTALSSYGRVFPLESVLEIVFQRGSTMHNLVPRDAEGRSNYRLGALRPNQFGETDVVGYVESIAEASGEFLEVVNLNLEGQQYAVAGTVAGLAALEADANERAAQAGGKAAFILIPGIDVPFHSRVLRDGVPDFKSLLQALIPDVVDADALEGRYIPNLVARPFEVTEDFARSILEVAPSADIEELVADFDAKVAADRDRVVRTLLIELLAWQFASPVRWIETQQVLLDADVAEWVEVGLASSPTLANIGARTVAAKGADAVVLNSARDEAKVRREDVAAPVAEPEEEPAAAAQDGGAQQAPEAAPAPAPAPAAPAPAAEPAAAAPAPAGPAAAPADDIDFDAGDALTALLVLHSKILPDQIADADSVETLTNGVSSKRNQVLMDLTAEFGLSSMDGAAEAPLSKLRTEVVAGAHGYQPFGPVLTESISGKLRQIAGAAGAKPSRVADYLASAWGLGKGWATHVATAIVLGCRDGKSIRGGELTTIAQSKNFDAMIDEAVAQVAAMRGVSVSKVSAASGGTGVAVDPAALEAVTGKLTDALADTARTLLSRLGVEAAAPEAGVGEDLALREAISAELGDGWEKFVSPAFSAERAVRLCDRWATAREDLARIAAGYEVQGNFEGVGEEVARQARWHAKHRPEHAERLEAIAADAVSDEPGEFSGKIAVVTGAAPNSIAAGVAGRLLAGGATVVVTSSRVDTSRLTWATQLYRTHARGDAELWLVPANLGSLRDIDALVDWIGNEQRLTIGASSTLVKPAFVPDFLFPFAAPPVAGTLDEAGTAAENQARVLLWGVERLMGGLSRIGEDTHVGHRLHVVLPGSPNRGTFGGDGAYGEVKAAFDAIVNKWFAEPWGKRMSLAHAHIGWVRGTGLMGRNDPLVEAVEAAGVRTWDTGQIADELVALCSAQARERATAEPIVADFTGGLDKVKLDMRELAASLSAPEAGEPEDEARTVKALPGIVPLRDHAASRADFAAGTARPEDTIVVVGIGEVGPWGSSRTRLAAELGIQHTGEVEMTAAGVLELAWMMGLLTWYDTPKAGWYDASGTLVPEDEIYERYRDEVVARSGIRSFDDDGPLVDLGSVDIAGVRLESDVTFSVADEAAAMAHVEADPETTSAAFVDDEWVVTRKAGALTYVPRRATLTRTVGGQFPTDFDPSHWGIPATMLESVDRMAVWNLLTTVDAFVASGFSPGELLAAVHPSEVASTQGTGFGGMTSMRRFYIDRFLGESRPQDLLQETLPNVIAAHTMQSFVGGYGSMIHPVGACATAAVSVEEGVDKIATGKASFVVAGGIDDLGVESLTGFGDMSATADSATMAAKGISERFYSRAGDLRRGGFVEAQGGGTVLLARGDLAAELGLPVLAVVGFVQSFADGAHTSIPAPGLGALAAARGGQKSRLAKNLAELGVAPDDISVLSKHDTSTDANDPNEAELHTRMARALGRTEGNPLYVISQKTLTGHSKGGAALFQMAGLAQVFASGLIPGNMALDCLDPVFEDDDFLVWLRSPFQHEGVKAALMSSLGFGHVAALLALVSPAAFEAAIERADGAEAADEWRERADERLRAGTVRFERAMMGRASLYESIKDRRFTGDAHASEAAMLLDENARLGADGFYPEAR